MAWNLAGKNWEGRPFTTPMSLRSFVGQVDNEYPHRSKNTDGTVASKQHDKTSPTSDHRPHPTTGPGVVRGVDVTVSSVLGDQITAALQASRDKRIKYVIWNRRSFRPPTWAWKPYGLAPHDKHFHISFLTAGDTNANPWQLSSTPNPAPIPTPGGDDVESLRLLVIEAAQKGWLPTQKDIDFWMNLAATPSDPQWKADFEPAWTRWKQQEWKDIVSTGDLTEEDVKAIINGSQVVAP